MAEHAGRAGRALSVLVTGAGGYIGRQLVEELAADRKHFARIVAADIRLPQEHERLQGVDYREADVRDPALARHLTEHGIDAVVHLAAIVTPGKDTSRELQHSIDVGGTENVLHACLEAGVERVVITSSGAAYGYHADNPEWLTEEDALRGNPEFAYSDHKRQVEELLARYREEAPELEQLILRPGTILGAGTRNQITRLFEGKRILQLSGSPSPFVLIWDRDVVGAILHGLIHRKSGIYNLAGDGALTIGEMAGMMGKPVITLPVPLVKAALALLSLLKLSPYGPEQVRFLRYRPVLLNRRLKEEFGYVPRKTSREVWEYYLRARGYRG
jgi:UDP-glucose 4-epimerase